MFFKETVQMDYLSVGGFLLLQKQLQSKVAPDLPDTHAQSHTRMHTRTTVPPI